MGELFGGTIQTIADGIAQSAVTAAGGEYASRGGVWLAEFCGEYPGVLLAFDLENMNPLQKISLFLGMMILLYTVVRIGLKRRMALASGQPSPRASVGDIARRSLATSEVGGPGRSLYDETDDEDRPRSTGTRGLTAIKGGAELESLVVNLREVGREIEARLDTKIRYAQRLMEEAEITLTNLEVARARAENTARDPHAAHRASLAEAESSLAEAAVVESPEAPQPTQPKEPESFFGPPADDDEEMVPEPIAPEKKSPKKSKATATTQADALEELKAQEARTPSEEENTPETSSQRRVRELAASGKSAKEIAAEVERPVGEIELILALGRGGDSVNSP